jgi:SAM-dependent methyltransferase
MIDRIDAARRMHSPVDVATQETLAFIKPRLHERAMVLEVGCGAGEVAAVLSRDFLVTAIDADPVMVERAQARGVNAHVARWPDHEPSPMDALIFTRSLHHLHPLADCVRRARECLRPGGVLLVEDFDYAADAATLRWFFENLRSGFISRLIRPSAGELVTDLLETTDPLAIWRQHHDHDLHPAAALEAAIRSELQLRESLRAPYLYRYLIPALPDTAEAAHALTAFAQDESSAGERGAIRLLGVRFSAGAGT